MAQGKRPGAAGRYAGAAAVVLAFVLGAFALHAAAGADLSAEDGGPFKHSWPFAVALLAGGTWVLAVRLHGWQAQEPEAGPRTGRLLSLLVPGVIVLGVVGAVAVFLLGTRTHGKDALPQPDPTPFPLPRVTPSQSPAQLLPAHAQQQHEVNMRWLLVVLAALLGLAVLVVLVWLALQLLPLLRRPGPPPPPPVSGNGADEVEQQLAEAVRVGRAALAGDDARAAIIACYAAMEESLAASGYVRELADTPEDLLRRARPVLDGPAAPELAALFREARYSSHPLGPAELARAEAALDAISAQLAARRSEVTA